MEEKRYAFGVKTEEKPLSVKDQMKFYIDNGKSFMLHGPSGVGKTRRVQELNWKDRISGKKFLLD